MIRGVVLKLLVLFVSSKRQIQEVDDTDITDHIIKPGAPLPAEVSENRSLKHSVRHQDFKYIWERDIARHDNNQAQCLLSSGHAPWMRRPAV